jgi:putative glutamine amidotransferase
MSGRPRIAIPLPMSGNPEYVERSIPQYERAVEMAGGQPVRIPLDLAPAETMKIVERCDAVLLPGASADVDPAKYDAPRQEQTAPADPKRDTVDELLLQDAYNMRKPILGICYGLQILNVYRTGSLIQHIESNINHAVGRKLAVAHEVQVEPDSRLFRIVSRLPKLSSLHASPANSGQGSNQQTADPSRGGHDSSRVATPEKKQAALAAAVNRLPVNSSHHQSADTVGDGLRVVARCPDDGIIEALEGTSPDHFVLAVQWHPERSVDQDEPSRAIFRSFVEAAEDAHQKIAADFEAIR